jgi:hypothetical protein
MKIPVTCPECGVESLGEFRIGFIANALDTGRALRLYAACHDLYWTATAIERAQLRQYLDVLAADKASERIAESFSEQEATGTSRRSA